MSDVIVVVPDPGVPDPGVPDPGAPVVAGVVSGPEANDAGELKDASAFNKKIFRNHRGRVVFIARGTDEQTGAGGVIERSVFNKFKGNAHDQGSVRGGNGLFQPELLEYLSGFQVGGNRPAFHECPAGNDPQASILKPDGAVSGIRLAKIDRIDRIENPWISAHQNWTVLEAPCPLDDCTGNGKNVQKIGQEIGGVLRVRGGVLGKIRRGVLAEQQQSEGTGIVTVVCFRISNEANEFTQAPLHGRKVASANEKPVQARVPRAPGLRGKQSY